MLRFLSAVAMVLLLSFPAWAQWQPLYDIQHNTPSYGTARDMAVVYWNDDPYVFVADYNTGVCRSEDEGDTWIWSQNPAYYSKGATLVVPNPYEPGHVYIARDEPNNEGFWVSEDYGATFEPRITYLPSTALASMTSIYIDPNVPHPVYITCKAVVGDNQQRIFKSANEGQSWTRVFASFPAYQGRLEHQYDLSAIYILPDEPNNIWLGNCFPGDPIFDYNNIGVWRSFDGGANWEQELSEYWEGIYAIRSVRKIIQNPNFPSETGPYCYVNYYKYIASSRQDHCLALYHKDNSGPGPFWADWISSGYEDDNNWDYFKDFEVIQGPDNVKYSMLGLAHAWKYDCGGEFCYYGPGVLKREMPWGDFTNINNGLFIPGAVSLAIDPGDYTRMYAASEDEPDIGTFHTTYGGVYKTTDWGDNWSEVTLGMHTCASLDLNSTPNALWAGGTQPDQTNHANMLTVKSGVQGWSNRIVQGSNTFRDFAIAGDGQYVVVGLGTFAGPEDSIYVSTDHGENFAADYGHGNELGEFYALMTIPGATYDVAYATSDHSPFVVKAQCQPSLPFTWQACSGNWPQNSPGNEAMAIEGSPSGNIVYAGTMFEGLYKLYPPSTTWSPAGLNYYPILLNNINAIEVFSKSTGESLLVAGQYIQTPHLARSLDHGQTWEWVQQNGIGDKSIGGIASHPRKRSVIAVTAIIDTRPYVYLSLDGGLNWADFSEGLDDDLINDIKDIVFENSQILQSNTIFIGTDNGIFRRSLIIAEDNITSDTTWTDDSEIFLVGDISISSGATLTIEPGTKIYFAPGYDETASGTDHGRCEFIVNGSLVADASKGDPITFKPWTGDPAADTAEWYGIVCSSTGSVTLNNCALERAIYGVKASYGDLDIRHCSFENIASTAVYSAGTDNYAVIDSNTFGKCYTRAIDLSYGVGHDIIGNRISECKNGIRYTSSTGTMNPLDVKDNVIENSSFVSPQDGIYISSMNPTAANVMGNTVNGFDKGIYLSNINSGAVTGNISHDNATYGIYLINVSVSFICQYSTYNSFSDNYDGISCNGNTSSSFSYNKAEGNSDYGVYVASGSTPNFGIAGTSTGHNALYNPSAKKDFYRDGLISPTVRAESCYWGGGAGRTYGNVDINPYMTKDPLPKLDPNIGLQLPKDIVMMKAYPNPFNPTTTIEFALPQGCYVTVEIFNIMGQKVRTLGEGSYSAGDHSLVWVGTNDYGEPQSSGVYFAKLTGRDYQGSVKMTLLR